MGSDAPPTIISVDPADGGIPDGDGKQIQRLTAKIRRIRGVESVEVESTGLLMVRLIGRRCQQNETAEAVGRVVRHARLAAGLPVLR